MLIAIGNASAIISSSKLKKRERVESSTGYLEESVKTVLSTDASAKALGASLSQLHCNAERPVAFASRPLTSAQRA